MTHLISDDGIPNIHQWNSEILETTSRMIFHDNRMATLGKLCTITARLESRRKLSVGTICTWASQAVNHEQIKLLKGIFDIDESGYIMWAWINDASLKSYLKNPKFAPHPSQWIEGDNLIIIDIQLPHPIRKQLKELLSIKNILKKNGVKNIFYRNPEQEFKLYHW